MASAPPSGEFSISSPNTKSELLLFVPGWIAEHYPHVVRAISEGGHELGHHSYSHTLADMGLTDDGNWDKAIEEREFDRALHILQELSGQEIRGYVPPGGELSPHSIEIMLSRGIQYQAQCAADDIPYYWEIDGRPCGLLEIPTHWSIDDAPQFLYTLIPQQGFIKGPDEVYSMWRGDFDAYRHYGRCLVFQVHPQWIGRPGRLRMFERLLQEIKGFNDVWWATGAEINDYWRNRYPPDGIVAPSMPVAPNEVATLNAEPPNRRHPRRRHRPRGCAGGCACAERSGSAKWNVPVRVQRAAVGLRLLPEDRPDDGRRRLRRGCAAFDAIYLGAIGSPGVPDHVSLCELLLPIRQRFDQYVNLRPMRLLPGSCPRWRTAAPADIDMICVRENSEGEYAGIGGRVHVGHAARGRPSRPASSPAAASSDRALRVRARPRRGRGSCWPAPPSRTRCSTPWCCGTKSSPSVAHGLSRRGAAASITSTRWPRAWSRTRRRSTSSSRRTCSATS